jgi:hypothetical protein
MNLQGATDPKRDLNIGFRREFVLSVGWSGKYLGLIENVLVPEEDGNITQIMVSLFVLFP